MKACKISNCDRKYYARGLCKYHWNEQWKRNNKEKVKQYYKNHKQRAVDNYQRNRKYFLKCHKQWRKDHPKYYREHQAVYMQRYYQTPTGRASNKACCANRRAKTKDLSIAIIQQVYEDNIKHFGTLTCILCFKWVTLGDESIDHLIPLSRGGSNLYENLGVAHITCNKKKGTKTLEEWHGIT